MSSHSANARGNCLHLLFSHAPGSKADCLRHLQAGDSLVLLSTAVLGLMEPDWNQSLPADIQVYATEADLQAQGLAGLALCPGLERINDVAWAELVMAHAHCVSWK